MNHVNPHSTDFLDLSHEVSSMPDNMVNNKAWLGAQIKSADWLFTLDDQSTTEIHKLATAIQNQDQNDNHSQNQFPHCHPADSTLPLLADDYAIPNCRKLFARLKDTLDNGVGFAVADKLPVDDYPTDTMARVFWLVGQLIGQPVSQKYRSQMIYDVKNTGAKFGYGVRGSITNTELNFHTDNAFGQATPDYVGLFCRHPAKQGGISRFCSLYALHDQITQSHPAALKRLYQPMYYDRQQEHVDGAPPVAWAPYFSCRPTANGRLQLRARANTSLVRKGYEVAGVGMDSSLSDALDAVDQISKQPQFWFEAALEKGQVQYLNNHETGHYRSEFVDFEEPDKKRHLYRLWHRSEGHWSYDGEPASIQT